jgi:hypothetical protein
MLAVIDMKVIMHMTRFMAKGYLLTLMAIDMKVTM